MTAKLASLQIAAVAIIGGGLDAVAAELVDEKDFNFTHGGFQHLLEIAATGMIIALAAWWNGKRTTTKKPE